MLRNPTAPGDIPTPGEPEVRPTTSAMLNTIIETHADALVAAFYDVLLQHEAAKSFLDHQAVHDRLSPSLNAWLRELFSIDAATDTESFAARQKKIGEIHARIKIPIHLVRRLGPQVAHRRSRCGGIARFRGRIPCPQGRP